MNFNRSIAPRLVTSIDNILGFTVLRKQSIVQSVCMQNYLFCFDMNLESCNIYVAKANL